MDLDRYQAALLAFLFDRLPIGDDVDWMEFALSGKFSGSFRVAHAAIDNVDDVAHLVFTLPTYSRSVFIALTRVDTAETARVLANLEDYERELSLQLRLGEAVVIPSEGNYEKTPHAVILLRTATAFDCASVPDRHSIEGYETSFFLAVPLSREEWELRRTRGHDALMKHFEDVGKQLFF